MAEVIELQKLKVPALLQLAELRQECEARALETKGNKGDLIARLQTYLEEHEEDLDVNVDDVLAEDTEDFVKEDNATNGNTNKDSESAACEDPAEAKVVKIVPPASSTERMLKRAERFNIPATAESKKAVRAARFGLPATAPSPSPGVVASGKAAVSVDQLKKRAERFGMNVSSISQKVEEDEKLKKRKERFGAQTAASSAGGAEVEAKKMKRAERFGKV
ncbi:SAP domain-containing ribonucleoprotein isoform X1 [Gadus morhua]|uniref:SAP domain-containing ribonucleoprotein isoform X1 n=1 Tax=Gadus morhua TaxID=8049 RepID=UPI0011B5CDF6|nr:SAP domain-containing ribonucleoprotein isoform X1 [Gadus morhua]XP_059912282.1 SAP domain-containing ribonucleoprotein isoform X1 [Gadus macrocephalus]